MATRLASRDFYSYIIKRHERGCWIWAGTMHPSGYGTWGKQLAHRKSWELANGPIPEGAWILHHCDHKPCVNPLHLYAGSRAENVQDALDRGRIKPTRKATCPKGHRKEGDNLIVAKSRGREVFRCRTCDNDRKAASARRVRRESGPLMRPRLTDQDIERIRALRRSGLPQRAVAAQVGRSLQTVQRVLAVAR